MENAKPEDILRAIDARDERIAEIERRAVNAEQEAEKWQAEALRHAEERVQAARRARAEERDKLIRAIDERVLKESKEGGETYIVPGLCAASNLLRDLGGVSDA